MRTLTVTLCVLALLAGCREDSSSEPAGAPASAGAKAPVLEAADRSVPAPSASVSKNAVREARAGEKVEIPAGTLKVGSLPGQPGRDPSLEPRPYEVRLNGFSIDRLPYPNDPGKAPMTEVSRAKAASLCEARQGRLCTELEWAHACRGPNGDTYAGSETFDSSCAKKPNSCASGFDVLAMGAALREWTSSEVQPIKRFHRRAAALRGGTAKAASVDHRCARRTAVKMKVTSDDLGFRCCYGDRNEATIASPKWQASFRRAKMPPSRLETLFAAIERLKPLSIDIKYFREDEAVRTVRARGERRGVAAKSEEAGEGGGKPAPSVIEMGTAPTMWNPVPGEEILLVTGRSKKDSFIVAMFHLGGDRYRVASILRMKNEPGPVVFVKDKFTRRKLQWTTCYNCYGEMGNITYRDDHRVVITQQ